MTINYWSFEVETIKKSDNKYYAYYQSCPVECIITEGFESAENARIKAFQLIDEDLKSMQSEDLEDDEIQELKAE